MEVVPEVLLKVEDIVLEVKLREVVDVKDDKLEDDTEELVKVESEIVEVDEDSLEDVPEVLLVVVDNVEENVKEVADEVVELVVVFLQTPSTKR